MSKETKITYKLVDDKNNQKRYAAFDKEQKNPITVQQWAEILSQDKNYQNADLLSSILEELPYNAYFFETKGVSYSTANQKQFEFVIIDSPALYRFCESGPDLYAFSEHFQSCSEKVCSFSNLGGDARLVAPKPVKGVSNTVYSNIAPFVRDAPQDQIRTMWKDVAQQYSSKLESSPDRSFWLSTCGTGVAWLHFRIDTVPKYYSFEPFASET